MFWGQNTEYFKMLILLKLISTCNPNTIFTKEENTIMNVSHKPRGFSGPVILSPVETTDTHTSRSWRVSPNITQLVATEQLVTGGNETSTGSCFPNVSAKMHTYY